MESNRHIFLFILVLLLNRLLLFHLCRLSIVMIIKLKFNIVTDHERRFYQKISLEKKRIFFSEMPYKKIAMYISKENNSRINVEFLKRPCIL